MSGNWTLVSSRFERESGTGVIPRTKGFEGSWGRVSRELMSGRGHGGKRSKPRSFQREAGSWGGQSLTHTGKRFHGELG